MTRTLRIDAAAPAGAALDDGGAVIRRGGLVAFPTESFYGLGADATARVPVERVFQVKGRPASKPLLVLVDSLAMVERVAAEIPAGVRDLMARHWPGPLTLVLRALPDLPAALTAGTGTVGVRMPAHAVARGLVTAARCPVTGPSANPSGGEPAVTAAQASGYFDGAVDLILDGGPTAGGTGSTVADCTVWPPRLLRQGPVAL